MWYAIGHQRPRNASRRYGASHDVPRYSVSYTKLVDGVVQLSLFGEELVSYPMEIDTPA